MIKIGDVVRVTDRYFDDTGRDRADTFLVTGASKWQLTLKSLTTGEEPEFGTCGVSRDLVRKDEFLTAVRRANKSGSRPGFKKS